MEFESTIGKLRGRGYKATPQRVAVLEAVGAEQHQSFDQIRGRCPGVGVVTVYRTLDLLSELGLLRRLEFGEGPRYELAGAHHHHLICESCGTVSEFDECPLDSSLLPPQHSDFEVRSHSLEVYGLCQDCA